jgi:hypothetical protein
MLRKILAIVPAVMIFAIEIGLVGIMYFLLLSILIALVVSRGNENISSELIHETLLIVLLLSMSLVWSEAKMYGLSKLAFVGSWSLFFILYRNYITEHGDYYLRITSYLFVVFLIYLAVTIGSPQSLFEKSNEFTRVSRVWGFSSANPIFLSRYLGFGIISLLFFLFTKLYMKNKSAIVSGIFIVVPIIIAILYMILTNSRGPVVSLLVAVILIPFFVSKVIIHSYSRYVKPFVIIVSFVSIIMMFVISQYSLEFVIRRITVDDSIYSRFEHIALAIEGINEYTFIFGAGTGNYGFIFTGADIRAYPHNMFFEIFYENGFLGFSLISYFIFRRLKSLYRKANLFQSYLLTCLVYYIVNAQFSGDLISNKYVFVFLILSSVSTIDRKNTNRINNMQHA